MEREWEREGLAPGGRVGISGVFADRWGRPEGPLVG